MSQEDGKAWLIGIEHVAGQGMPATASSATQRADLAAAAPKLSTFAAARFQVALWHRQRIGIAPRAVRRARADLCHACPHFWPQGAMITGFCALPASCCRNKPALAGSRCPLSEPHWAAFPEPGRAGATPVHASGNPRQIGPIS